MIATTPANAPAITAPEQPRQRATLVQVILDAVRLARTRIGLALTLTVVAIAVVGPLLSPYDSDQFVGQPLSPPTIHQWFGTDTLGRDVFSRFLDGGRTLLLLAAVATIIGVVLGTVLGVVAAYRGGWVDETIMRAGDVILAFPQVMAALVFVSIIGPELWLIVLIVGLSHAPRTARVIRAAALTVVERDFVKSAEAIGMSRWAITRVEILPNIVTPMMVEAGLRMTYSIGLIASLSFLGLGVQPPAADWGVMINENRIALTVQPWSVALPVIAIAILTIGFNLVADGVSRASSRQDQGVSL